MNFDEITFFTWNKEIWLTCWKKKTAIKLDGYVEQLPSGTLERMFPLFLFYIEIFTMILPC
jgi:hypothetical protein